MRPLFVVVLLALALAGGAMFTADAFAHVVIALTVCGLLGIAIDVARDPRVIRLRLGRFTTLPFALTFECLRRLDETLRLATSSRWRAPVRGLALALPLVAFFGLLLAGADPILAAARTQLADFLTSWEAVPRMVFFGTLFVLVAGGCGTAVRGSRAVAAAPPGPDRAGIGRVERTIVLAGVTTLFAAFLLLQLSYLFGNPAAAAGSGVTFAEYARRGFAELTIVATLCLLLIVGLDHAVDRGRGPGWAQVLELVVLGELALFLASAFRRLLLYEDAYGFTTARVYGQVYMVWLVVVLVLVALELRSRLDRHRIVRRAGIAAALALIVMVAWNHEAWIVRENVARFAATKQFDPRYAVWSLSPNAVPALVDALGALPPDIATHVRRELTRRHGASLREPGRWYEWNVRRAQAARALRDVRD